jgi:hypothetical protein
MFPLMKVYDVEDVRGFFLQMTINDSRTMYQMHMELMAGAVVALEATRS